MNIVRAFTSLFFPELCYGCGSDLVNTGQLLCLRCQTDLPFTNFINKKENPVAKIFWGRMEIDWAASLVYFSKQNTVAHLLHQLKYRNKKEVGDYCGRLIGRAMIENELHHDIDAIVPLPLFKKKERIRGYNQATLICNGIASIIKKPVLENVVSRNSFTETQTRKSRVERWQNMQDRFVVEDHEQITGKHLLLVDDVITTGATLEACGSALLEGKDCRISIFTFAYSSSTG